MPSKIDTFKRIALFAPNLAGGGAERVVSILAHHLANQPYEVDLVLAQAVGPYLANIPDTVNVIDFGCDKVVFCMPKLIKYLRNNKPDIVFSSQMHSSTIALWAATIAGVGAKVYVRQPTMLIPSYENMSWTSKIKQKVFLRSAWLAEKVIVSGHEMAKEFQALSRMPENKIVVIHNPVPIDTIKEKSFGLINHPWFESGGPPVILSVGRLVGVKGFETLIRAFSIVQKTTPARLIILGEGKLRRELESLVTTLGVGDLVLMPGFSSNPYSYMKHARVFVSSSFWEGFPNGMVEAMACGTAIVATNCKGSTAEILENGKWGRLVPVADEEMMAKAILESLDELIPPKVECRVECFAVDAIAAKYEKLFMSGCLE